ncbi:UNVERIFIED_CONTAM: hypothetical protein Slati_1622000 [Sesamum latifolium]|uniref:Uncharacterized protein n=1 Tax=Sesamum latifolium TaxID=2727402 RepID=A0AAW2XEV5_9LAMI
MASYCSRNLVQRSSNTARTLLFRGQSSHSVAAGPSKLSGLTPTIPRPSPRHRSFLSSRLPVELGCGESLMPLHSVTASALLNSMLSSKVGQWGFLSEANLLVYNLMELVIWGCGELLAIMLGTSLRSLGNSKEKELNERDI